MRLLPLLYPKSWRTRYREEFDALLDDSPRDAGTAADVARGAIDAHRRTGWRLLRPLVVGVLLLLADVVIAWLNYNASDDVQAVALALILAGFGFTFWRPRWGWLFVVLLWLAVPASSMVANAYNHHPGVAQVAPLYETLVALIPTAIGAVGGAVGRWGSGKAGKP